MSTAEEVNVEKVVEVAPSVSIPSEPSSPLPASTTSSTVSNSSSKPGAATSEIIQKQILAFGEMKECPEFLRKHMKTIAPIAGTAFQVVENSIPVVQKAYNKGLEVYEQLKPYKPELLVPSFIGFIMCFFGGSYLTLIAAVEAFRQCGYHEVIASGKIIISDFQKVVEVSKKDDEVDADNDGVSDVLQISNRDLLHRKVMLFLKTVDPNRLMRAFAAINTGFMAVIATLKLNFAKTITLGNSMYDALEPPLKNYVLPKVEKLFPPEYRKWAYPILSSVLRSAVISVAWTIQRIISAFHSAMKGGLMFSRNILHYLDAMGIYKLHHEDTYIDEIVGGIMTILGLYFQLSFRFSLPFPLNILLFPFSLVEYILIWLVSTK